MNEEDEAFNEIERRSKVKQTLVVHASKEAMLLAKIADYEGLIRDLTEALRAQAVPPPPMECKTDAEKIAYAYGWFKALELNPARKLWAGLTEEEIEACFHHVDEAGIGLFDFAEALEAKLKEKNT